MSIIHAHNLVRTFQVHQKEPGLRGALKSFVSRKSQTKYAVKDVSFDIEQGELIGFIGPNGAGKTTTLKMLSGLLLPTSGDLSVIGYKPFDRKPAFLKQIALVMGQKNQLWWDLPAVDTFLLNKAIYEIETTAFEKRMNTLIDMLEVRDVLNTPVRKLSLGQRMKMELIAALLHEPKVLFLDEPTIGLDVIAQEHVREFIKEYNQHSQATIILTSHYMEDVKQLCKRVVIIDHGTILYDGSLSDIISHHAPNKLISVILEHGVSREKLEKIAPVRSFEDPKVVFSVPREKATAVASAILTKLPVEDLSIEEPNIEDVIRDVFVGKA